MKHVTERPFADPDAAARQLVQLASSIEPVNDRIHMEKINCPFLYTLKGSGAEFGARIRYAIEKGWLELLGGGDQGETLATIRMGLRRWGRTEGRA